jgi:CCR4-NOT transcription complex subunit 1
MEVFSKYLSRLIAVNAGQIFPNLSRAAPSTAGNNHHLLAAEIQKLSLDPKQSRHIAEAIETGSEDVFRDFDLSTFMEHFGLDALEKTVLALAFKLGPRADLKTKGMVPVPESWSWSDEHAVC